MLKLYIPVHLRVCDWLRILKHETFAFNWASLRESNKGYEQSWGATKCFYSALKRVRRKVFSFEPGKTQEMRYLADINQPEIFAFCLFFFFGGRCLFVILSATRWRFQRPKTKKLKNPMSESTFSYVALQLLSFHFISFGRAVMCVKFATVDRRLLMAVCLFGFWLSGDSQ